MNKQVNKNLNIKDKINSFQKSLSKKQQWHLVKQILLEGIQGEEALLELLINRRLINSIDISYLDSVIFECLFQSNHASIIKTLNQYFHNGIVTLNSNLSINYQPLQDLLMVHRYQESDKWTQDKLCKLAGLDKNDQRDWLYFTDVSSLPVEDLKVIDLLWQTYSRHKFGFSEQRQIWLSNDCDWEKFWHQIGWKNNGISRRYPSEFLWDINAPSGHLPLFNQLRGAQVLYALFNHIV